MPEPTIDVPSAPVDFISGQEKIQAKVMVEFMLKDLLSNLEDVQRADSGIQAILYMAATSKQLARMFLAFQNKSRRREYLQNCTQFQKRILLFFIAHYACLGDVTEPHDLHFTTDKLLPLEAILARLEDVRFVFGENVKKSQSTDAFYDISLHTVKQHVLMLIKRGQYSIAGKFLMEEKFLKSDHRSVLENMVKHCVTTPGLVEKIMQMKDHSYLGYYTSLARFIHGLNESLGNTTLDQLAKGFEQKNNSAASDSLIESDDDALEPEIPEGVSSPEKSMRDQEVSNKKQQDVPSPKISLSYRLRKRQSGIIIPCKNIIQHCQKVTEGNDLNTNEGFFRMPVNPVKRKTNAGNTVKSPPKRRVVLGDRFETASVQSSTGTYGSKKKTVYTLEIDSYIAEGCLKLGVGNWASILRSFPFPSDITNMKIKDRFRFLVKKNFIAVLDDGDISVLHKGLKASLAAARAKMNPQGSIKSGGKNGPTRRLISPQLSEETSSSDDKSEEEAPKNFEPMEDAYLVCGAMHLGLRWDAILEYMDFRSHITVNDMQKRWDTLINKKAVEIVDGCVECVDVKLKQKCKEVAELLKSKILSHRKRYCPSSSSNDSARSEEQPVRRRKNITESDDSDNDPQPLHSSPAKSPQLNKSIDAGTQTSKLKIQLGNRSPDTLEERSSTSASEKSLLRFPAGSPIRPSTINLFKNKKPSPRSNVSPRKAEMRRKRQRQLARIERRHKSILKRPWTETETSTFLRLLDKHEPGSWSKILDDGYDVLNKRTPVMLKDKFRNLLRKGVLPSDLIQKWEAKKPAPL